MAGRIVKEVTIVSPNDAEHRVAKTRGAFDDGIKHGLGVCRRPADYVEDFTRCCLVLESFAQFLCTRLNLSKRRTFSMAIAAWSAKVVTSSICCSVKDRGSERASVSTPSGIP